MRAQIVRTGEARRSPSRRGRLSRALAGLTSALVAWISADAGAEPMQGFPQAPENQVTLGNWNAEPYLRWTSRNLSILPFPP